MKLILVIFSFILPASILQAQTSLDTAVNFTVKDVNGITHRLHEYLEQDKIVVVDFFTITCGPCSTYAPLISTSYEHFGCNMSNVVFLGINWGADNAGVSDFGITNGVKYPEISGTEGNGNHVVSDYGVLSYPTVILILPDSYIAEKYIWPPETGHLDSIILAYGGIMSPCTTPIYSYKQGTNSEDRIISVFPLPAEDEVNCLTNITSSGYLDVLTLSGCIVQENIPIKPGEKTCINTSLFAPGYYLLILRNNRGEVIDRKPLILL